MVVGEEDDLVAEATDGGCKCNSSEGGLANPHINGALPWAVEGGQHSHACGLGVTARCGNMHLPTAKMPTVPDRNVT